MKKLTELLVTVAVLCFMLSVSVFAAPMPEYQVLSFTISGAETYPDGSQLKDGECYALVWSGDGEFDGFEQDGTPTGTGDEVLYIGKIVKDGTVSFQLPDGFISNGVFGIYILDTRVFDDNGKVKSVGKSSDKIMIHDYVKLGKDRLTVSGSQAAPTTDTVFDGTVITGATVNTADIPALKFTSIKVDGDWVVMTAVNSVPNVNYSTKNANEEEGDISAENSAIITLIRPKEGNSALIRGLVKTVFSTGDLRIIITIAAVFAVSVLVLAYKRKKRGSLSDCGGQK